VGDLAGVGDLVRVGDVENPQSTRPFEVDSRKWIFGSRSPETGLQKQVSGSGFPETDSQSRILEAQLGVRKARNPS